MTRFAEIDSELSHVQNDVIRLKAQNNVIRVTDPGNLPSAIEDPVVQELTEQVASLSGQYAAMSNRFSHRYHPLQDLAARLRETKRRLNQATAHVVDSVREEYNVASARQAALSRERDAVRAKIIALNQTSLQDAVLQREVDITNQIYKSVLARLNEIESRR
jgi:uncharacterized protein involved in exopolysaccharide biosynthesis